MSLRDAFHMLVGRGKLDSSEPDLNRRPQCPHESDLLAYSEGSLSERSRAQLEGHLIECDDCRELLALFAQLPDEGQDSPPEYLLGEGLKDQTDRVLAFIKEDEFKRSRGHIQTDRGAAVRAGFAFNSFYMKLSATALVVCAITVAGLVYMNNDRSAELGAGQALAQAVKSERRIEPRVSGGLEHSPYSATRGTDDAQSADIHYDLAISKLKYAEERSADQSARLALARVYLARGERNRAERALAILTELAAAGLQTPELFNDTGVAYFQIGDYRSAADQFSRALERSPSYNEALFNLALAEQRGGDRAKAEQDWKRFLDVSSDRDWKEEAHRRLKFLESTPDPKL